ncbi:MAG: XDD3 family exosortase-dependent surface protein [Leptolyngbyaceae cyanobacterium]
MKNSSVQFLGMVLSLASVVSFSQAAQAANFDRDRSTEIDWLRHDDSHNDSIAGNDVGGTRYELYSTAVQVVDNFLVFGVRSNFTIDGTDSQYAHDRFIKFSDIILNCVDNLSNQVAQYGINFDAGNESAVPTTGIYETPTLTSRATANGNDTDNFGDYNNYVRENGGDPIVGTLDNSYFDANTHVANLMTGGNWIGEAFTLSSEQQANLGLDDVFAGLGGTTTAIAADISKLQETGALCSFYLGQECNNDLTGGGDIEVEKVPEPAAVLAITVLGLALPVTKRWKSAS